MQILFSQGKGDAPQSTQVPVDGAGESVESGDVFMPLPAATAYAMLKRGVPSRSLLPIAEYLGLSKDAVAAYVGLDRATAHRKITRGDTLPIHAAESVLRLLELSRLAEDTFTTPETAAAWLRTAHPMLGTNAPFDWAKSAYGTMHVKEILTAIKYGNSV